MDVFEITVKTVKMAGIFLADSYKYTFRDIAKRYQEKGNISKKQEALELFEWLDEISKGKQLADFNVVE